MTGPDYQYPQQNHNPDWGKMYEGPRQTDQWPKQPQKPRRGTWGWPVGIAAVVVAFIIGFIANGGNQQAAPPKPAVTVTAPAPPQPTATVFKNVHPTASNVNQIASQVHSCAPWDTSGTTSVADVWASDSCNVIIGFAGDPAYGNDRLGKMQGDPQFEGWYLVNGSAWVILVHDADVAELFSNYYHVEYEAL